MAGLPQRLTLTETQQKWASQLDPVLKNPVTSGIQLTGIKLVSGDNTVNHLLGQRPTGYIITSMYNAFAQIYTKTSQTPALTLILNSSGTTTVDLYVY